MAVLGHIDHGKTSLLDKIRETNVGAGETKGITQHIGASVVRIKGKKGEKARAITFIDTPGHTAFSKMRSRGAKVADLAILVVAADEGFRPQTKESWEHICKAGLPCIVALNKVDLPMANLEGARESLFQNDIPLEEGGGEVPSLPVSAKTGEGIRELLEMILLMAEMNEVKGDPEASLEAVVIESELDKRRGPAATVVVRDGRLKVGQEIWAGKTNGKIRALLDDQAKSVKEALPGQPVEVLGFKEVPEVGSMVTLTPPGPEVIKTQAKKEQTGGNREKTNLEKQPEEQPEKQKEGDSEIPEEKGPAADRRKPRKLDLILKADVTGTLEAVKLSLPADVKVILALVGDINEGDVLQADSMKAVILGFRVRVSGVVKKLAEIEGVEIQTFMTVYDLLEWVEEAVKKLNEPVVTEEILGKAEIIAEFEGDKQKIAGAVVREGRIAKKDRLKLLRSETVIGYARVRSLKTGKDDVNLVPKGSEFGVVLDPQLDFEVGDVLVSSRPLPLSNG